MAIPAFRAARAATGNSTKITMVVPTGTSDHDYLLCIIRITGEEAPTAPEGWGLIAEGSSGTNNRVYAYDFPNWRSETSPESFTWELGVAKEFSQEMVAIKEAHHTEPRVGVSAFKQTTLSTTVKCAAMTISAECLGVILSAAVLSTATYTANEANEWKEDSDSKGCWAAHKNKALTSNLTEQQVATSSTSATNYWVLAVGVQWGSEAETYSTKATISGTGTVTTKGLKTTSTKATVSGTGTITSKGVRSTSTTATATGTGSVTTKGSRIVEGKASVSGSGSVSAAGTYYRTGKATVSGTGSITASGLHTALGKATIAGTGTVSAVGFNPHPILRGVGTWRVTTGASPMEFPPPVGTEVGDLAFICLESAGAIAGEEAKETFTPQTPEGWTRLFTKNNGNTRLTVFGQILTAESEFVVAPAEAAINHMQGQTVVIKKGTFLPVPLASAVVVGSGETSTGTKVGCGSINPGVSEALYLLAVTGHLPDSNTTTEFSSWTATNQEAEVEEIGDRTTAEGDGGALGLATIIQPNATSLSSPGVTAVTSASHVGVALAVMPNTSSVVSGQATIAGTSTVTSKGTRVYSTKATVSGTSTISAAGIYYKTGKATVSGTGAISPKGLRETSGKASVSGTGSVTAKGVIVRSSQATVSGTGSITTKGVDAAPGKVVIAGTSAITANSTVTRSGKATITGTGTVKPKGTRSLGKGMFILYEGELRRLTVTVK